MEDNKKLTQEDLDRVEKYLSGSIHQVERKPFRPWLLLGVIVGVMVVLSLFSYLLAYLNGVV